MTENFWFGAQKHWFSLSFLFFGFEIEQQQKNALFFLYLMEVKKVQKTKKTTRFLFCFFKILGLVLDIVFDEKPKRKHVFFFVF